MKHNPRILKFNNVEQLKIEMKKIGADPTGIHLMLPKGEMLIIKIENVSLKAANIIKQEMLSKGGEAVLHKGVSMLKEENSEVILMGTKRQLQLFIQKLKIQPFGLPLLAEELTAVLKGLEQSYNHKRIYQLKNKQLHLGNRTLIMGILNVTPDSFSDGGRYQVIDRALEHAQEMIRGGADIIDIGGESTRPNATPVSLFEELNRVIPVLENLRKITDIPISIDTYKAEVAEKAILAGADIVNDVWGLKKDKKMAEVVAKYNVPVIIMHNREEAKYQSFMDDVIKDLRDSISLAHEHGILDENIILDPGIGFAKSYEENLLLMNRLDEIVALGYPVLLGTSRKSLIGKTLDLPPDDRLEGTIATVTYGISKGVKIVRVHDVLAIKRAVMMTDALHYYDREGYNG